MERLTEIWNQEAINSVTEKEELDVRALQAALLEEAEVIAGTAQMLLDFSSADAVAKACAADLNRIHENSGELYQIIRNGLSIDRLQTSEDSLEDNLKNIRHDVRGVLGNILNFGQLILMDQAVGGDLMRDLTRIVDHSRMCVDALNASRGSAAKPVGADEPKAQAVTAAPVSELSEVARDGQTGALILVADDNPSSQQLMERFLRRQGHQVAFAGDGKEALAMLQKHEFDLVLLDIRMPKMDGFEVLEQLRRDEQLGHTPVIVISGMDSDANTIRCIELGAEDFLSRPIDMTLLKARVNACLEKQRLREREFEQYFTPELARKLVRHPEMLTEGRSMDVTVLFCDIVGFSGISERLGPTDTIRWVSDVMGALSECVMAHGGVLVDYIGDELMAMWGAPNPQPKHAELACRAARDMIAQLAELDKRWSSVIGGKTSVSIGINSGEAYVGNVGTSRKFKYGALGNAVNLASRVQGATKYLKSRVLMTGETRTQISGRIFSCRRLCRIRVKNIEKPVEVHELATEKVENWAAFRRDYETALKQFERGRFHRASSILGNLMAQHPDDGPSLLLMSRTVNALLQDPEELFEPIWELPGK